MKIVKLECKISITIDHDIDKTDEQLEKGIEAILTGFEHGTSKFKLKIEDAKIIK